MKILAFASPVYWKNEDMQKTVEYLQTVFSELILITSSEDISTFTGQHKIAIFIPLSGGVQPLMLKLQDSFEFIGLYNGYMEKNEIANELLIRNAHPSCTDFYAWCRMNRSGVSWLADTADCYSYIKSWEATKRLQQTTILKIGETESWVINSATEPEVYKKQLGVTVIPISTETVYARLESVNCDEVKDLAGKLQGQATCCVSLVADKLENACRIYLAIKQLMEENNAQGISLACFKMATELQTTGCVAVSLLNTLDNTIASCEGDLEAAVSLLLLKELGNDFVWVANPIIHENCVDLVHCTAPTVSCGNDLNYKLLPHHETGHNIALEVDLPANNEMTIMRIGNGLKDIVWHSGQSEKIAKLDSCHTQIRINIESRSRILDTLMGTHFISTYGNLDKELKYCAQFLGLNVL